MLHLRHVPAGVCRPLAHNKQDLGRNKHTGISTNVTPHTVARPKYRMLVPFGIQAPVLMQTYVELLRRMADGQKQRGAAAGRSADGPQGARTLGGGHSTVQT